MTITEVTITIPSHPRTAQLRAHADICIDRCFRVRGFRVVEVEPAKFAVYMPSTLRDGQFEDVAYPSTREAREMVERAILEAHASAMRDGVVHAVYRRGDPAGTPRIAV
ncbi:MAG TPA: septation protein SpoVG family protein [Candidatus Limnocylindrales bacterium]|nr:septation protein SpoVG family protein [Candidatus Limnocylindrales bacterium]